MKYKDKRGAPFCNYFDVNCREGLLLKMLYVFRGIENIFLLYIKRAIMSDTTVGIGLISLLFHLYVYDQYLIYR